MILRIKRINITEKLRINITEVLIKNLLMRERNNWAKWARAAFEWFVFQNKCC